MGQRTDAKIQDWQQRAGIEPAQGERLKTLDGLSQLALELINVVALERSGIRDGDGCWHGSDPVEGLVRQLGRCLRYKR